MPSGGSREKSGRKSKWGEESMRIGVPSSIGNDLIVMLENFYQKGITGKKLIDALNSTESRLIKKYPYPVSAGADHTSSVGGDSMNTDYEEIDLYGELILDPDKAAIIPVTGDSMIDIGIYPNDWLIVELIDPLYQQPEDGDIVVVALNDEVLVKRYKKDKGKTILLSENKNHPPILESEGSIYISGIVKSAIHRNLSKL